jgi:hypothetical protein
MTSILQPKHTRTLHQARQFEEDEVRRQAKVRQRKDWREFNLAKASLFQKDIVVLFA